MDKEITVLLKLLSETSFETGEESLGEKYFNQLWDKYGIIANRTLQKISLQNTSENQYVRKHILFIVGNMPIDRRDHLEAVPLEGISNLDIEIQDLAVRCFEAWEDKKYLPTLRHLYDRTDVQWFKDYIIDVIQAIDVE